MAGFEFFGMTELVFATAVSGGMFGLWRMLIGITTLLKHEHVMSKGELEACIEPIRDHLADLQTEVSGVNTELAHIKGQLDVITRGGR